MSRFQSRDNSAAVSLFPFLAVLLCTMGGLVVLLVAMSHSSRQTARREQAQAPRPEVTAQSEEAARQLAEAEAYAAKLAEIERRAAEQLRDDQLRIAQVEDHVRKLQEEMAAIMATAAELESDESSHYDDRAQAERELARLHQLIADTEAEIAQLKSDQEGSHKSYAVLPYKGPSGTRRQPIYIECRAERVLLQPEGIELTPDDFQSPLGVGNPLAAALRAAREHLTRDNPDAGIDPDAEPYPLILIRPDGIGAYYKVRDAIHSWESDFGYEMVDGDWNLEFPAPDPQLAMLETRAIENARIRRDVLAQAAPRAFSGGAQSFAIDSEGQGYAEEDPYDPNVLGDGRGGSRSQAPSDGYATGGEGPSKIGGRNGSQGVTAQAAGPGGGSPGGPQEQAAAQEQLTNTNGSIPMGLGSFSPAADSAHTNGESGSPAGGAEQNQQLQAMAASGAQQERQSGASQGGTTSSAGSSSQSAAGSSSNSTSASFSSGSSGSSSNSASVASLNNKRGPDDVALRRTVTVAVFADRLLIGKEAVSVPMPGPTGAHVETFVSAVRQQIDSWGLAGSGLYWRPVIKLDVRQGGGPRAGEIKTLLTRSGIDVEPVQTAGRPAEEPERATR